MHESMDKMNSAGIPFDSYTLAVTFRAGGPLRLPAFPGNLWRGAFGPALKHTSCFSRQMECGQCPMRNDCLYPYFYEDLVAERGGARTPPRPFAPHVEWEPEPQCFEKDDLLGFSLTLFSKTVWARLPYLVAAFDRLGRSGLSRDRTPLFLESIDLLAPSGAAVAPIFRGAHLIAPPDPLSWPEDCPVDAVASRESHEVELRLLTPMIIERHGRRLDRELPFEDFIRALLRRRHDLIEAFPGGWKDGRADAQPLKAALREEENRAIEAARSVVTLEDRVFWQSHSRNSRRQMKAQSLSGLLGTVRYGNVPGVLLPILRLGVLIHVGKSTVMGMGAYSLRTGERAWTPPFRPRVRRDILSVG